MEIKQLTYTALAEGWKNERIVGNPSEKERTEFNRISRLLTSDVSCYAYDYSNGVSILSYSAPYGTDVLGRARLYAHGFVFSLVDCDFMFSDYPLLLAVDDFAKSEADELKEFPSTLPGFAQKVPDDHVALILECVYEALLNGGIFEIRTNSNNREYFIRAVMNTIYEYIPLPLRKFISFASAQAGVVRMITATDQFSSFSNIRYDFDSRTCEGLCGSFSSFVSHLISGRIRVCDFSDSIGSALFTDIKQNREKIISIINDLIFKSEISLPIADVDSAFAKVLKRNRFNNIHDTQYLNRIFTILVKDGITLSYDVKAVCEIFDAINSLELKANIARYLARNLTSFNDVISLGNEALACIISKQLIAAGNEDFIIACSEYVMTNRGAGYLLNACTDDELHTCKKVFYAHLLDHPEKIHSFLCRVYENRGDVLQLVESDLLNLGLSDYVEEFYISYLSKTCKTNADFEAQKQELSSLGISTDRYVDSVLPAYCELLKEDDLTALLEKVHSFAENANCDEVPLIYAAKYDFWETFNFDGFDFSDDIQIFSLDGNPKSDAANALLALFRYVRGEAPLAYTDFLVCKNLFCTKNSILKNRKKMLSRIRSSVCEEVIADDIETTLLLSFSPDKMRVDMRRVIFDNDALIRYITDSAENSLSLLHVPAVAKTLFSHLRSTEDHETLDILRKILKKNSIFARFSKHIASHSCIYFAAMFFALFCVLYTLRLSDLVMPAAYSLLALAAVFAINGTYDKKHITFFELFSAFILIILLMGYNNGII